MKNKLINFKIEDFYKLLWTYDQDILDHFNDDTITDNDYFFYVINSDIISNTLNIVINVLSKNIESAGVDLSCRVIIEA